ncbi:Uncharacterized protein FWK35_00029021 [Aphis craccivora]|uniref:Uncharacterized protein n=1 Tax=Aphis craccivora TaxID=307492 RepID=A0A6G0VMI8_APHCR|nr:Uncharacterized protein FWK35_00029021 [Aphis craccivora]
MSYKMKRNTITKRRRMKSAAEGELVEIERFKSCSRTFIVKNKEEIIDYHLTQSSQQSTIKFNLHVDSTYEQVLTNEVQDMEEQFISKKSLWSLKSIDCIQLRINKVNPLKGGIIKKKSGLDDKNRCFTSFGNKPCKSKFCGRPIMFEEGDDDFIIYFKNYKNTQRIPIVIYADFECILNPDQPDKFFQNGKKPKTHNTHLHRLMSYGFYFEIP